MPALELNSEVLLGAQELAALDQQVCVNGPFTSFFNRNLGLSTLPTLKIFFRASPHGSTRQRITKFLIRSPSASRVPTFQRWRRRMFRARKSDFQLQRTAGFRRDHARHARRPCSPSHVYVSETTRHPSSRAVPVPVPARLIYDGFRAGAGIRALVDGSSLLSLVPLLWCFFPS